MISSVEKTNLEEEFAGRVRQREESLHFQVDVEGVTTLPIEGRQETRTRPNHIRSFAHSKSTFTFTSSDSSTKHNFLVNCSTFLFSSPSSSCRCRLDRPLFSHWRRSSPLIRPFPSACALPSPSSPSLFVSARSLVRSHLAEIRFPSHLFSLRSDGNRLAVGDISLLLLLASAGLCGQRREKSTERRIRSLFNRIVSMFGRK